MKSRPVEPRRVLAATVLVLLAAAIAWACGPFFPAWILGTDHRVLEAPVLRFADELPRLLPKDGPRLQAVPADGPLYHQTATVDREELAKALEAAGVPAARRTELLAAHQRLREAFSTMPPPYVEGMSDEEPPPPEEPDSDLSIPAGLPGEFEDYLRGAVLFYQRGPDEARAQWRRLLERPESERRYRSTWAAFMLGKLALREDPADAVRWFERTRELASQGFADGLGLAASSLGWQARAEWDLGRPERAFQLYAQQAAAGDPTAPASLRFTSSRALEAGGDVLGRVARDPEARRIVTAYVITPRWRESWGDPTPIYPDARTWLEAVQAAGVTDVDGADRLAWAAYMGGDFAAAGQWAERSPDAPLARWIRAKLLLRDGKLREAEEILAGVARDLPAANLSPEDAFYWAYDVKMPLATGPRAAGEAGAIALSRGDYVAALDRLLRSGYWTDAAYVAERVLTVDELRAYVGERWPAEPAAPGDAREREFFDEPFGGVLAPDPDETGRSLRYLLARRLARLGHFDAARPYLPEEMRAPLDELTAALDRGRDSRRPRAERAEALFRAACITRHQGMELQGTEVEPDWTLFGGSYDAAFMTEERMETRKSNVRLPPAEDELRRAARHLAKPGKRFHYRYDAADLAREAAALLPDGSEEKARMLAVGGNWIKLRDPQAALPLYRELTRCCRRTDLGREAARRHWFPEVEEPAGCAPVVENQ
ncbi:MAG TPA: hypothetical protein VEL74_16040 [Thermoanaerobaculia bacterium]|nr:hypothetical protein [Thermoanaerobaculia bacterium]